MAERDLKFTVAMLSAVFTWWQTMAANFAHLRNRAENQAKKLKWFCEAN